MQHCEECGSDLRANARFCGHCGKRIDQETEATTNLDDSSTVDLPVSPLTTTTVFSELQDSAPENDVEEKETPHLVLENDVEEEQQLPQLILENDVAEEEQTSYQALENDAEEEEQTQQDYLEPTSSMPGDTDLGPEIPTNQFPDEEPQYTQTPIAPQETQSPYASAQKSEARPASRCLLFFLAGFIVVVGVVVALMGLFHLNLQGIGGSSNAVSNSSDNEIINPTGSSLTASICVKTSTPSTSATNQEATLILFSSSGCSAVVASKANSSCLIFPNNTGASHKYIFDVSNAAIDSKAYHLVLGVVDYTGPTTYNDARHISVGLSEGSTGRNFSWLYRSGSVIIKNDEQSGTMDVILEAVHGGNTLHIVGDWACGRQMKNT